MKRVCQACKGTGFISSPEITSTSELIRRMRIEQRDVYLAESGRFFITHGCGEVSKDVIQEAIRQRLIVPRWPDLNGCWRLNQKEPGREE